MRRRSTAACAVTKGCPGGTVRGRVPLALFTEKGLTSRIDQATHNKIVSFIWGIADDVLRDLFKRGKYPDVILPMCVLRRFDAVLEPTKKAVLETKHMLDKAGITEQRAALAAA